MRCPHVIRFQPDILEALPANLALVGGNFQVGRFDVIVDSGVGSHANATDGFVVFVLGDDAFHTLSPLFTRQRLIFFVEMMSCKNRQSNQQFGLET